MQIDWQVITIIVVGYFAINGFLRGWWKEAILTFFLAVLLILLQQPDWAQLLIDALNSAITAIVEFITTATGLVIGATASAFQLDPNSPGTWLVILFILIMLAALLARSSLPTSMSGPLGPSVNVVEPVGRLLGFLLGALNGFLILSLVREYLDGRGLPGTTPASASQLTLVGESSFGPAASDLSIQATGLPRVTVLDSFIPWVIIGVAILLLIIAFRNRVFIETDAAGGRRLGTRSPYGYRRIDPPPVRRG
jgi:hypothetical protein